MVKLRFYDKYRKDAIAIEPGCSVTFAYPKKIITVVANNNTKMIYIGWEK